jgi:hypothetical protein
LTRFALFYTLEHIVILILHHNMFLHRMKRIYLLACGKSTVGLRLLI